MIITPKSRREFEKHINLLSEGIIQQTFKIPPDRKIINRLLNLKYVPNRRIDFLTIDESTRLLANTLNMFEQERFNKKANAE